MYNVQKFNVLLAIKLINEYKIPATGHLITDVAGLDYPNVSSKLSRYYRQGYVNRNALHVNKRYRCTKYRLSKKGKSVLEKFSERMLNGQDLNIRKAPQPHDWTDIKLVPNLYLLDALKDNKWKKIYETQRYI